MSNFEFHPAANEFPLLDDGRIDELARDIESNGQHEPIRLCEGRIVDGRNRYLACLKAGVEPQFEALPEGADPFAYVWSFNGERRDLTQDQRYLIWKSCMEKAGIWQAERRRILAEANRARSESQKDKPRGAVGERPSTNSGRSSPPRGRGSSERALSSGTNRGAVERMDRLARERTELESRRERLSLPAMDREFLRRTLDDFEAVMASEENAKKKHLLRQLVKKVLVHNRDTVEVWYGLPGPDLARIEGRMAPSAQPHSNHSRSSHPPTAFRATRSACSGDTLAAGSAQTGSLTTPESRLAVVPDAWFDHAAGAIIARKTRRLSATANRP